MRHDHRKVVLNHGGDKRIARAHETENHVEPTENRVKPYLESAGTGSRGDEAYTEVENASGARTPSIAKAG